MSLEGEVLFLSFGYALIGALLLVVVTKARLSWTVKAGAVVVTSAFYVVVFFRTQGLLGWSAPEEPPNRFQLLWARVVEPNIANKTPGAIHIWVESLDDANLPSGVPRAYRLPYSPALARTIAVARDEIMNGHPQGGRALAFGTPESQAAPDGPPPAGPLPARVEAGGDPSSGGFLDPAFLGGGDSKSVEFAPLPEPRLPPKDVP